MCEYVYRYVHTYLYACLDVVLLMQMFKSHTCLFIKGIGIAVCIIAILF